MSHTLFVGRTLCVGAQRNLAALWVCPVETYSPNFVNFGLESRDTMWPRASILH